MIGAGGVGTSIAFTALNRGVAQRISLYDVDSGKVRAEVLDLRHGLEFVRPAVIDGSDDIAVCAGADVVVLTAGAKQKTGESRLDLATRNARILHALLPRLTEVAPDAVILLVTNPVDVLTHLAIRITGKDDGTVLGSGTVLDSSRLRHLLASIYGVAERHVHAHVVGEHGDSETVLWSTARIGGVPLDLVPTRKGGILDQSDRDRIADQVRNAAYEIIAGKGATTWAISLATTQILGALDQTTNASVLPVSATIHPELGLGPWCVSLPRLVDRGGAGTILPLTVSDSELEAIQASSAEVRRNFEALSA